MRIGVVSRALIPGGHVAWATGLCRGFSDLGHSAVAIYLRDSRFVEMFSGDLTNIRTEWTFRGLAARTSEAIGWPLSMAFLGGGYGKEGSPDPLSWVLAPLLGRWARSFDLLVFAEDFTAIGGLLLSRLRGTPYVVFVHESPGGSATNLTFRIIERVRRTVRSNASLTCAIDEPIAVSLQARAEPHIITVPLGCDPLSDAVLPKSAYVLADSRWTPARNPGFLVEVAKRTPNVSYIMLGSFWTPSFEQSFHELVKRAGLEEQIRVLKEVDSQTLTKFYQRATAYVRWAAFGSGGWEMGFPTGIRIALSNSCPVVYDKRLGCASFLQSDLHTSAADHDADSFGSQILSLWQDPQLVRKRAIQSLDFAKRHPWSWSASLILESLSGRVEPSRGGAPGL